MIWDKLNWKNIGLFIGGALFGSLGVKVLASKDAKRCYTQVTAAALRAKDYALKQTELLKENCEDIYEKAKDINEDRISEEEVFTEVDKNE